MKHPVSQEAIISNEARETIDQQLPVDYLLALAPHEALWNQVKAIREQFAADYKCETAKHGLPYITLAAFRQHEAFESRIRQKLKAAANGLSSFIVELKDFGSLPSHTIYINIVSKVPIVDAVKALRGPQKLMKLDKDYKPFFVSEPHFIVAKNLQPRQYEKAWLEYREQHFRGRFIADHVLLLKRGAGGPYKVIDKFVFNAVKQTTQATLF